ncbi:uncharacterized protein [Miscanthus floridulus]|uniref:uncharacterized protein n=1 Tax=Miscanthus floridulus TaxID=154761 RepID=UPI0034580B3A
MFFELYAVHPSLKTRFAALNFRGVAKTRLLTVQRNGRIEDWVQLCDLVMNRFDKNQYQLLLKRFEVLKQSGSVDDYQAEFEKLAQGILLYNSNYDDTYFVTRFVAGLKEEIRSVITLHRPKDVDTASALALHQEEELSRAKNKFAVGKEFSKSNSRQGSDRSKWSESDKSKGDGQPKEAEDKLAALRDMRRKNSLCFKCGAKWSHTHKCPAQVPLHVLEEILDALEPEESDSSTDTVEEEEEETVLAVSQFESAEKIKRRTMRICGTIGKLNILILIDSGSVGTFISTQLAQQLQMPTVASFLFSWLLRIPDLQWCSQGQTFTSSVGILPLKCFDMILGQDWLEDHSPMWVHWGKKLMKFTLNGKRITLQGLTKEPQKCVAVGSQGLKGLLNRQALTHCLQFKLAYTESTDPDSVVVPVTENAQLPEIETLLQQYSDIFKTSTTLPPPRPFDHNIPLLPGAQPVNIRAYRYSPAQKTEIEKQLTEMLDNRIIKHSSSPYASPVLLVIKKDGSWRFCVDYRHLNAQTVKNKQPMPIVEELIDELAGAQWFSKLDFRAGYHQLYIHPEDTHKTAFRTHNGLYEFLVMPFGLTNAPETFQSIMNYIFAKVEYLGHCISGKGVATEPSKISAVQQWPRPQNLKQLRGFLGLTGYYRKFIKSYGMISKPLSDLLKKFVPFLWTSTSEEAFLTLKDALVHAPVLAIPNFEKQFVIETDASDVGFGAVLMQEGHPVAFLSKPVSSRNQALSTHEKECMAIILAVDKWRSYLQHQEFIIKTDHRSLLHLTEQRIATKLQQKALLKLMDLQFKIIYKQGVNNQAADALSRCYHNDSVNSVMAVSVSNPACLDRVRQGYQDDPTALKLLEDFEHSNGSVGTFTLKDGSPFEVLYGHTPRHFVITNDVQAHAPELDQWLLERNLLQDVIQHQLHRAQQRMKHYADQHRSERELAVGEMVYLKLQPYIQSSVAPRSNQKLSFRFYGPFRVLERIGAAAYRLELPDACWIHPVVHISQLKRHVPPSVTVEDDITAVPDDPTQQPQPLQFLANRMIQKGASTLSQIQVRWSEQAPTLLTWEEATDLRRRFPNHSAWGQPAFQGRGNVRNGKGKARKRRAVTIGRPTTEKLAAVSVG